VHPLDELIRDYVHPLLREHGYKKQGRTFRLKSGVADYGIVTLSTERTGPGVVAFFVTCGVVIPKERPWLSEELQAGVRKDPGIEKAQYMASLLPSPGAAWTRLSGSPVNSIWGLDLAEPNTRVGEELRTTLAGEVIPLLDHLLGQRGGSVGDTPYLSTSAALPPFVPPWTKRVSIWSS
jgi:hypothetical protein